MEKVRISKYLSEQGIMSRRAADEQITLGHITVNGTAAVLGQKIDPDADVVKYNGKRVGGEIRKVCVMLNKPAGYVTTMNDEMGRKCVSELVADVGERVYPIGRLDRDSEGLLLLTNDGELANMLTHPKYHKPKVYHVWISGRVADEKITALSRPINIDGYITRPAEVGKVTGCEEFTVLAITLFEGRNRQIRKMCERDELQILTLRRMSIGEIRLGTLSPGKWKFLSEKQIESLKKGGGNA